MSHAREALRTLAAMAQVLHQRLALGEPLAAKALSLPPSPPVPPPDPAFLEGLRRRLWTACEHRRLAELPRRELRQAPLVFWNGTPEAAGFPGLVDVYLEQAAARPAWLRTLLEAWLRDFGSDRPRITDTGQALGRLLTAVENPRLTLWRDAHEAYRLFDAAAGPRNLGGVLLLGPPSVATILTQTGMNDALRAEGRFFRAAVAALLTALPAALRGPNAEQAWARAVQVLEAIRDVTDRQGRAVQRSELRFRDLAGPVAQACLGAWLEGVAPSVPRDPVKNFLVRTIGDPRVNPQAWAAAGEPVTALMRRWLSADSLEAFLALITGSNEDMRWRHRRAFWRACLRVSPFAEVWVVLGSNLAQRASTIASLNTAFGQMTGTGSHDQAVLLMKLGSVVLSEWSNVGRLRAWDAGHPNCPTMDRPYYAATELRADSLSFLNEPNGGKERHSFPGLTHHGSENFLWQERAAEFLRTKIGLRLTRKDYTP